MSRKELREELERFATECDKLSKALAKEVIEGQCVRQSPESKLARASILEAHRDWANNLIPKL